MISQNRSSQNMENSAQWNTSLTNTIPRPFADHIKIVQTNSLTNSALQSSIPLAQHSRNINTSGHSSRTAFFEANSRVILPFGAQMVQSRLANLRHADRSKVNSKPNKSKQIRESSQHIVYVEDRAFIAARSPTSKNRISPKKVIKLSSRQKSKNQLQSNQKSKNSSVYVAQSRVSQNRPLVQVTPQTIRPVSNQQQALLRKINILQKRVADLHLQKQKVQINCAEEIKKIMIIVQQKDIIIKRLENDVAVANFKIQCEQKQNKKLSQSLGNLQKIKRDLQCQNTNQSSATTQNFINITLSEQIENLKTENKNLLQQLIQFKQKQQQKTLTQTHQTTQIYPVIQQKLMRTLSSGCQSSELKLQISEQILEIDSQQMQIQQIIHKISHLSKQNQLLKSQLQQSKIQMEIKDTVATETAKIIQQIKDAVPITVAEELIIKEIQHQQKQQEQDKLKLSIKRIQDIITQV